MTNESPGNDQVINADNSGQNAHALSDSNVIKDEMQLVTFLLGEEEFGFDIMDVQEIIRTPKIARVPLTPNHVDGVANLRGTVLPIVDMRSRFNLGRTEDTDRTRVLVVDLNGTKTGLRVDRVKQVTRITRNDIEKAPEAIGDVSGEYINGVIKLEDGKRIIMALHAAKVCQVRKDQAESQANQKRQASGVVADREGKSSDRGNMDVVQMVTFMISREEFGFPIDKVREILRVETPRQIPEVPEYLLGVLTVRGKLLPIIDLRKLLNQQLLSDELCSQAKRLLNGFNNWHDKVSQYFRNSNEQKVAEKPFEDLRTWFDARNSSNQILMESVAKIRGIADHVAKALQDLTGTIASREVTTARYNETLDPLIKSLSREIENYASLVPENIKEDQRIIVVDSNGTLLGLVVDHVKEVLNAPKNCIDPAPTLSESENAELSGIAKLKDGTRLIMVLESAKLLKKQIFNQLKEIAGSGSGNNFENAKHQETSAREMDERQLVTFRLGEEEFGIPIARIREIDRYSHITHIPKVPEYVEGVTNLRGEVIPVVDLRCRFSLQTKVADDRTRIIIVDLQGKKTGLRVDSVSQVLNISNRDVEPPPRAVGSGEKNKFISGIAKIDSGKRMIVLLDVEKILANSQIDAN
ncbi:MAG: chemotaxis protein CheW [Candidatus Riflebacteria bacterium]|nr:chemotaxis protein CheW [Candidatus Riflebacteria bacterium]